MIITIYNLVLHLPSASNMIQLVLELNSRPTPTHHLLLRYRVQHTMELFIGVRGEDLDETTDREVDEADLHTISYSVT